MTADYTHTHTHTHPCTGCGAQLTEVDAGDDTWTWVDNDGRSMLKDYWVPVPFRSREDWRRWHETQMAEAGARAKRKGGAPLGEYDRAVAQSWSALVNAGIGSLNHWHEPACDCNPSLYDIPGCTTCGLPMRWRPSGWSCRNRRDRDHKQK